MRAPQQNRLFRLNASQHMVENWIEVSLYCKNENIWHYKTSLIKSTYLL